MPKENRLAVVVSHPVQHFAPSLRDVSIRFHLKRSSWIPVKLLGEVRAILWACRLTRQGPRLTVDNGMRVTGCGMPLLPLSSLTPETRNLSHSSPPST